jgi:autotransporter translocation and assembly factor TamB
VKKSLKIFLIISISLVLLLGGLVSLGLWALNSPEGTRALLKTLSLLTPLKIEAREISGRMKDELKMGGLRIRWPGGELQADSFHLRWQPGDLWDRKLLVREISFDGVRVKDNRPETGPVSFRGWPVTPFWLSRLQGQVDTLLVQRGSYQRLQENPIPFNTLSSRLQWDGGALKIQDFTLEGPPIRAAGSLKMGFSTPSLSMEFQATLSDELAGFDSFQAKLGLEPVPAREEAKGSFSLSARKKAEEHLRLEGTLGLTRSSLQLQNLLLLQPGKKGRIQGEGEIAFAEKPVFSLKAAFSGVTLIPDLELLADLSGTLEAKGPLDKYRGRLTVANQGKGWQKVRASAAFRGSLEFLDITALEGNWLEGSVTGPLKISWTDGFSLQGNLQGRKLNPEPLIPGMEAKINLNLDGRLLWPREKEPEVSFGAKFLESILYDTAVSGEIRGSWKESLLRIADLRLQGQGFDLRGKGTLQEKLALDGQVTDLAKIIPGAKGRISVSGWLRYREDRLSGTMVAGGKEVWTQEATVKDLHAELQLKDDDPKNSPVLSLVARAGNIKAGGVDLSSVRFQAEGSPAAHRAQFAAAVNGVEFRGEVTGAYQDRSWKGSLEKLDGRDDRGPWNLQGPARVTLSADRLQVSPLVIRSGQGERLQAQADLTLNPFGGSLQAQWQKVDLARANPWVTPVRVSGISGGSFTALGQKSGWQISANSHFEGTVTRDPLSIEIPSGEVRLDWNGKGLLATTALKLNNGGSLDGRVSSPDAFQFNLPREGKLEAQWKALDLVLLQSLLPAELILKGKNSGTLNGAWFPGSRFEASGKTQVSRAQVLWPGSSQPFPFNLNTSEADFTWQGESLRGNLTLNSADHGSLKGIFLLPLSARFSPSFIPEGLFKVSVQGQLRENGLLSRLYPERVQNSRGEIGLDLNAEGTWSKPQGKGTVQISGAGFQIAGAEGEKKAGKISPGINIEMPYAKAAVEWDSRGLVAGLAAILKENGTIEGTVTSSEPPRPAFPRQGKIDLLWTDFNLALLQPLLPEGFLLEGKAEGKVKGALLPDLHLDLAGGWKVSRGKLSWKGEKGQVGAEINQADVDFLWRGERVQGNVSLSLADYGSLKGHFRLPIPARFPFQADPAAPLQVTLQGQAQEKGLLSAFFPGMVEETRGTIDLDLSAQGTWGRPDLQGSLRMSNAGASIPSLGIRVDDLSSRWRLRDEQIQVESLRLRSGSGYLEGTGTIWLKRWEMERFEGTLKGEKFQTFYLPNMRIQSSPKLQFRGTPRQLSVRGEILLPEVHIYDVSAPGVAKTSSDIVMVDQPAERESSLSMDIQVRVILGDQVDVKAGTIDARLAGDLDLKILGLKPEEMTARGEIRLTQGFYGGYGLSLRIDRGRFTYAGGPVDNPSLDILALRRSDDVEKLYNVKVGVAIFGTLKHPNVKLYSQPVLKDEEILSYLILARPYDPQKGNLSLLVAGAGGLLSGDSLSVLDRMKSQLGIDTVDIQTGGGDMSRSMVTVGKYLTPELYVSYGYSVFSEEYLLKLRYRLSKHWEVETWRGNQTGVDLYYRIEFY